MTGKELIIEIIKSGNLDAEIEVAVMDVNNDGLFSEAKYGVEVYYDPDCDVNRIVGNSDRELMTKEGVKNYISDLVNKDINS